MNLPQNLLDILGKYGLDPEDPEVLWDCHGKLILSHRAYEHIAAEANVVFKEPRVLPQRRGYDDEVAIVVFGRIEVGPDSPPPDCKWVWSIGESSFENYKSGAGSRYPYAMAEKRAKDRVIGKLVGLSEFVYSEEEADDFSEAKDTGSFNRRPDDDSNTERPESSEAGYGSVMPPDQDDPTTWETWERQLRMAIGSCNHQGELKRLWHQNEQYIETCKIKYSMVYTTLLQLFSSRKQDLMKR